MDDSVNVKFGGDTTDLEAASKRAAAAVAGATQSMQDSGTAGGVATTAFSALSTVFGQLKDAGSQLGASIGGLFGIVSKTSHAAEEHGKKVHEAGESQKFLSEASNESINALKGLGGGFSTLGSLIGVTTAEFAGLASAFAIFETIKESVETTHEFNQELRNMTQLLGINGLQAAGLGSYFEELGMKEGAAQDIAVKFARTLTTNADAFKEVGINIRDANGNIKPFTDLMFESLDVIKNYKAGTDQNAVSLKLFGRSFSEIVPLMYASKEGLDEATESAKNLGLGLTEAGAAMDREYTASLDEIHDNMLAFQKVIGTAVMPAVIELAHWFKEEGPAALSTFKEFVDKVVNAINFIAPAVSSATKALSFLYNNSPFGKLAEIRDSVYNWVGSQKKGGQEAGGPITGLDGKPIDPNYKSPDDYYQPTGGTKAAPDFSKKSGSGGNDTGRARYQVIQAELQAELSLLKEHDKEQQELDDDLYKHNLESIADYYGKKTALEQGELDKAIEMKKKEIAQTSAIGNLPKQGTAEWDKLANNKGGGDDNKEVKDKLALMAQEIKLQGELAVMEAQRADVSVKNNLAMADAEQKQAKALQEVANTQTSNRGAAQLAQEQAALDQQKALQKVSTEEYLATEVAFENQRTAIAQAGIQARVKLADNDPVQLAQINADIEKEELDHQAKLTALANEGELDRQKYALQASTAVENSFTGLLTSLTSGNNSLKKSLLDMANSLEQAFSKIASSMIAEKFFGAGTAGGGGISDFFSKYLGTGGGAAGGAAGAASATAPLAALGTTSTATTTAMASLATAATTAATALMSVGAGSAGSGANSLGGLLGMMGSSGGSYGAIDSGAAASGGAFQLTDAFASIPSFAVGTDNVPSDMLAFIHKGERITPAAQNFSGTRGAGGMTVHNHFAISGAVDQRTQQQIAAQAGNGVATAIRRNQ